MNKLTIKEVANKLNITEQLLRVGIQQEKFDFAIAIKNKKRCTYYINEKKFKKYLEK